MSQGTPQCFGRSWDGNNPMCRGGADVAYSDPITKSNIRSRCNWFESCGAQLNASRTASPLVPTTSLVRPPTPLAPPLMAPPIPPPAQPRPVNAWPQPAPQVAPQPIMHVQAPPMPVPTVQPAQVQQAHNNGQVVVNHNNGYYTQPQYAAQPIMVPMNAHMVGAQIPSFLTVPEPDNPGVSLGARLANTLIRSVLKAGGVALANFFDYHPLGK